MSKLVLNFVSPFLITFVPNRCGLGTRCAQPARSTQGPVFTDDVHMVIGGTLESLDEILCQLELCRQHIIYLLNGAFPTYEAGLCAHLAG